MSYRVPVLETFSWQKQIGGIVDMPPASPTKGDRYIVGQSPSGWSGSPSTNQIAWYDTDWKYDTPAPGWVIFNSDTTSLLRFDGSIWDLITADEIRIDNSQFSVQIPSTENMTLQELLVWMDANFGGPGPLGTPTDGTFADGLLEWDNTTHVNDAIDDVNEVLKDLAPPQANSLAGTTLTNNRTLYSGVLPAGLSSDWYQDGKVAGSTVTNVMIQNSLTLTSASPTDTFGAGDQGYLNAASGVDSLAVNCKLNIAANFVEPIPGETRVASQDLNLWKNKESVNYPCSDCDTPDAANTNTCAITKGDAKLVVTSVGKYNDFNMWQKMNANMQYSNLAEGFHQFQMIHQVRGVDRATTVTKVFYDNSSTNTLSITGASISEASPSLAYLSGVSYYGAGSTFQVQATVNNIYQKIFRSDKVATVALNAGGASSVNIAPDANPNYNDAKNISTTLSLASNVYNVNVYATVDGYHPYKTVSQVNTGSVNRMINTYGNVSTVTSEYWRDENYRLPTTFDTDTVPANTAAVQSQWTSANPLGSTDALVYNQSLQYGNINFTTRLPSGSPDYSTKSGSQIYMRAVNIGTPKSGMTLTLTGLTSTDVAAVGSGNLNVEIKLPSQTGWCDIGTDFNANTFDVPSQPKDGQGCRVSVSGSIWTLTFGGKSTLNTNGFVFIRITFRNTSAKSITGTLVAA